MGHRSHLEVKMSRYNSRRKAVNDSEMYEQLFEDRGVKKVVQYSTPRFKNPSREQLERVKTFDHVWTSGDKFWRLAAQNYGDPKLWWVLATFNKKPTEGHLTPGDVIKIPVDLAVVLGVLT